VKLILLESKETRKVSPEDTRDYQTFSDRYRRDADANELATFERFYAAKSLVENGLETYLDPMVTDSGSASGIPVDACGIREGSLTIVFCGTGRLSPALSNILQLVYSSQNAQAVILTPAATNRQAIERLMPAAFQSRKVKIESLGWFEDHLDSALQDTLRLIGLLGNETRMRMLTPLFQRTSAKRDYRTFINPKLVYQNLSALLDAGLVDEQDGTYELSELGKTIVAEFITFLEKTRKAVNSISKAKGGESE